jgi:hypothetical protein
VVHEPVAVRAVAHVVKDRAESIPAEMRRLWKIVRERFKVHSGQMEMLKLLVGMHRLCDDLPAADGAAVPVVQQLGQRLIQHQTRRQRRSTRVAKLVPAHIKERQRPILSEPLEHWQQAVLRRHVIRCE